MATSSNDVQEFMIGTNDFWTVRDEYSSRNKELLQLMIYRHEKTKVYARNNGATPPLGKIESYLFYHLSTGNQEKPCLIIRCQTLEHKAELDSLLETQKFEVKKSLTDEDAKGKFSKEYISLSSMIFFKKKDMDNFASRFFSAMDNFEPIPIQVKIAALKKLMGSPHTVCPTLVPVLIKQWIAAPSRDRDPFYFEQVLALLKDVPRAEVWLSVMAQDMLDAQNIQAFGFLAIAALGQHMKRIAAEKTPSETDSKLLRLTSPQLEKLHYELAVYLHSGNFKITTEDFYLKLSQGLEGLRKTSLLVTSTSHDEKEQKEEEEVAQTPSTDSSKQALVLSLLKQAPHIPEAEMLTSSVSLLFFRELMQTTSADLASLNSFFEANRPSIAKIASPPTEESIQALGIQGYLTTLMQNIKEQKDAQIRGLEQALQQKNDRLRDPTVAHTSKSAAVSASASANDNSSESPTRLLVVDYERSMMSQNPVTGSAGIAPEAVESQPDACSVSRITADV